jgi:GABA(A) receptor-associated protein
MSIFKRNNDLQSRKKESKSILDRYKNRIPVICEKSPNEKDLPVIDKIKYLVSLDITEKEFKFIVRRNLNLNNNNSLCFNRKGRRSYKKNILQLFRAI